MDIPPIRPADILFRQALVETPSLRAIPHMRFAVKTALESLLRSIDFLKFLSPAPNGQTSWDEFKNKLQAFYLFEYVDSVLDFSAGFDFPFLQLIAKAESLGPYFRVWTTEGLGHYYTELALAKKGLPDSLLDANYLSEVPSASLVPLHTGMGLSLAQAVLNALDRTDPADYGAWLDTFSQLCRTNSQTGYAAMAYEALGLVACNLHPRKVAHIDRYLLQTNTDLLAYFWHGIGRAVYFAPINFLPFRSAPWQGLERCRLEAPHILGKRNAVAGFAWALTLVNIKQPEILAAFLRHHEQHISENDAFENGVSSALMIWCDASPGDPHLEALHYYQPLPDLAPAWNRHVRPCFDLVLKLYPSLKAQRQFSGLFRYQDFSQFVRV